MSNATQDPKAVLANIQKVAETSSMEMRDCRGMSPGEVARQGDVYVTRVNHPDDLAEISKEIGTPKFGEVTVDRQLAPGSTRGSRHIIGDGDVTITAPAKDVHPCQGPLVEARGDWVLTHPEHAHAKFGEGLFVITYQRDYAREERARVSD